MQAEQKVKLNYLVGTMIEIPRGALTADEIAQSAEFFSFGTNDLTQTGARHVARRLGLVPADVSAELEIVKKNPFATIDQTGVGQLVDIAVTKGRQTRPDIKLGICGEHGGDPSSIHFFEKVGLDYVSCSPYRVPVARLAAAQAALSIESGELIAVYVHENGKHESSGPGRAAMARPGLRQSMLWVDLPAPAGRATCRC